MTTIRRLPGVKAMQTALTLKEVKALAPWPVPGQGRAVAKAKRRRAKS